MRPYPATTLNNLLLGLYGVDVHDIVIYAMVEVVTWGCDLDLDFGDSFKKQNVEGARPNAREMYCAASSGF